MRRRSFLKSGASLASTLLLGQIPLPVMTASSSNEGSQSYRPGESISKSVFVQNKDLRKQHLVELCSDEPEVKLNVLYIYGGGANNRSDRLGGIWCPDSFEDSHALRFIHQKYNDSDVRLLPVACPPIYSSRNYGLGRRVFLDEADESAKFQESVKAFIQSTEAVIENDLIPVKTYYDIRHRLLFNRRDDLKPGEGYGDVFEWQGKFRGGGETQKYGTPTIWLIDSQGKVLAEPFWGNYYHSEPFKISYTVVDLDKAIQRHL
ncbi:hypothetical protein MJD09_02135 [bacterium]|nr:hypothetical protein [bacterium]